MTDKSVDAAASTSNKRKKLTDEERKERKRESAKRSYHKHKERHKEERNERSREYYKKNKDKIYIPSTKKKLTEEERKERKRASAERWRQRTHRPYDKQKYEDNKEKRLENQKRYRQSHREKICEYRERYKQTNREKLIASGKRYYKENKDKIRERINADPIRLISTNIRVRFANALKGNFKTGSAVRDLGMTVPAFKEHLESLFDEHMTWDNWGTYWHLDHIYPLAKANLEDRVEFLAVNNWRNLQPLEKVENIRKGDTVTPEAQKLFDDLKTQFLKEDAA